MSVTPYARSIALLREAAIHAAWVQWSSLGLAMHGARPGHAVIDPEALVLASLAFDRDERRLDRVMVAWLTGGARLLSAGRFGNLMKEYPEPVQAKARSLAASLVAAGDARFKRLAGRAHPGREVVRPRGAPSGIALRERTTLMLKLRLALGVGIKADALAYLIGLDARYTVRQVSDSLGYEERPTRRALEDLHAAGFVGLDATSPVTYRADLAKWQSLLAFPNEPPLWRQWRELYQVVAHVSDWESRVSDKWTPYVQSSRLRDLLEVLGPTLVRCVPDRPDWQNDVELWPGAFHEWASRLAKRMHATA
jgi:hypothetical protein